MFFTCFEFNESGLNLNLCFKLLRSWRAVLGKGQWLNSLEDAVCMKAFVVCSYNELSVWLYPHK